MIRLQSHYLPSIPYMAALLKSEQARIDTSGYFEKQSYRNRTVIAGPNGLQNLVVPIFGRNHKQPMSSVRISYREPWVRVHTNALHTAYASAPYFDYLFPELTEVYAQRPETLLELNSAILIFLLERLKVVGRAGVAMEWELLPGEEDLREAFHPKKDGVPVPAYPQVFQEKHGFLIGASVLDLMMNDLTEAKDYLLRLPVR